MVVGAVDWGSVLIGAVAGALLSTLFALVGVSLFQARVDAMIFRLRAGMTRGSTEIPPVTGIWRSHYVYTSDDAPEELESEHNVVLRQSRSHVVGKSLPKPERSVITLDLEIHGLQLTGRWREFTSQERLYRGGIQLELDETRTSMSGVWVGFSRTRGHMTGRWTFERLTRDTSRSARRRYSDDRSLI